MRGVSLYWSDTPMSFLRYMTLHSLRAHNPDMPITLHTSRVNAVAPMWSTGEQQDFTHYAGEDWRDRVPALGIEVADFPEHIEGVHPNSVADICRWWSLAHGYIWSDMDIIYIRPFTEQHLSVLSGDAVTFENSYFSLGLCSGTDGSRLWSDVYDTALSIADPQSYQAAGVGAILYLVYGARTLRNHDIDWASVGDADAFMPLSERYAVANIPMRWVHPITSLDNAFDLRRDLSDFPDDVVGVHWFAGNPTSRGPIESWTPDSIGSGTIAEGVRRAWKPEAAHAP